MTAYTPTHELLLMGRNNGNMQQTPLHLVILRSVWSSSSQPRASSVELTHATSQQSCEKTPWAWAQVEPAWCQSMVHFFLRIIGLMLFPVKFMSFSY